VQDSAIGGVPTSGTDVAGDDTRSGAADGAEQQVTIEGADAAGAEAVGGDTAELDRVRRELEERTADLQRVSAEYANYRRRVERDREGTVSGAKAQVAGELLTVLDDVERASAYGDLTGPFKVVADRLTETLHRVGLTPFGAEGDAFDPSVHEAVAHETSGAVTGPTVTTVMRRGYRFGERVLRPAMVAVTDADPDAPASGGVTTGSPGVAPDAD
jgi:molecular chaperone GrpE